MNGARGANFSFFIPQYPTIIMEEIIKILPKFSKPVNEASEVKSLTSPPPKAYGILK